MARGSAPGERRGGRQKGVPNKATRDIRAIAQEYTATAIQALVDIASAGESEKARVDAAIALLDRGYGRPSQHVEATGDLIVKVVRFGDHPPE